MIKNAITVLFIFMTGHLSFLFSQIEIDSTIQIGDTGQLLLLETHSGDQLVGSATSWEEDTLFFLLGMGSNLVFHLSEIKNITALEGLSLHDATDYSKGEFTFISDKGQFRRGQLLMFSNYGVRIRYNNRRRAFLQGSNLLEAKFSEQGLYGAYPNNFRLKLEDGSSFLGHLVGISPGHIDFQPLGRAPTRYSRISVKSIYPKKERRPVTGHQRSLLITPTGFNLQRGEAEFRNINYFINTSYSKGLTNNVSMTFGVFGVEPYVQVKTSKDFGKYLHLSVSGGVTLTGAAGGHASLSLGTPDHFLNMGFMKNRGDFIFGNTDMNAIYFGGSFRIGDRQRLIGEMIHVVEERTFLDFNQYGTNGFGFGYGWFGRRISLTFGLMLAEKTESEFCFVPPSFFIECNTENYSFNTIPVISTSIYFGDMYKK